MDLQRLDDLQRQRPVLGFPLAVVYKFFDDQGNYLAAVVTYYAFLAILPMLLIASSVLGFLLQDDPQLKEQLLDSALAQFPIVGQQLGSPGGLQGSTQAVVVGSLVSLWGVTNLGQAAQNMLNAAWGIPRNTRLNPVRGRLRSVVLMVVGGLAVLAVAIVPNLADRVGLIPGGSSLVGEVLVQVLVVAVTAVVLSWMMAYGTSLHHSLRTVLPGGVLIAVLWHLLQALGGFYVGRVVSTASEVNGIFALVLGLIVLIYAGAVIAILGIEVDVVHARRLYPRALLTPFTDDVELTAADRKVYTQYAKSQRHKGFERIEVSFDAQDRAREDRAGVDRAQEDDAERDRAGEDRTERDRAEQRDRAEPRDPAEQRDRVEGDTGASAAGPCPV